MKPAQFKPPISPDLLNQIDIRVGTILTVTDVPNSEKLVALEVSFGDHKRNVLVGMKVPGPRHKPTNLQAFTKGHESDVDKKCEKECEEGWAAS